MLEYSSTGSTFDGGISQNEVLVFYTTVRSTRYYEKRLHTGTVNSQCSYILFKVDKTQLPQMAIVSRCNMSLQD